MKKNMVTIVAALALIFLFPIRLCATDGGSVQYRSLTYSITKVHSMISEEEAIEEGKAEPYNEGFVVEIFGIEVFDNVK